MLLPSDWVEHTYKTERHGIECSGERLSRSFEIGMLINLDEGTLSVYKNGSKFAVMQRGLAGHYCWVVSLLKGSQVTIKRETVPAS